MSDVEQFEKMQSEWRLVKVADAKKKQARVERAAIELREALLEARALDSGDEDIEVALDERMTEEMNALNALITTMEQVSLVTLQTYSKETIVQAAKRLRGQLESADVPSPSDALDGEWAALQELRDAASARMDAIVQ